MTEAPDLFVDLAAVEGGHLGNAFETQRFRRADSQQAGTQLVALSVPASICL